MLQPTTVPPGPLYKQYLPAIVQTSFFFKTLMKSSCDESILLLIAQVQNL